ncbi:putative cytidine deaminase 1, 2, 7 [Hibiscus syriacus]|uniref:PRA1 family protein n=1 Tax=Hibiscus syriacus TaxID=106335 RepID=A0A6A2XG11_HIBSY|nr:PRA1 family protein F2-like [Hibiscus syriacus]KAE8674348.1 putative cytidine deaminase 1, 2, 7 [Hibiscus syriacus]
MTTYGTIPAELPPSSNFISQAREQIRSGLCTRREWKEMVKTESIKLPTHLNDAIQRFRTNAAHFRVNYVIVILFLLFLTLLWQPVSLIVFIIMMAAWLFLYFLRDDPVSIEGFIIDDRIVMTGLLGVTIAMLMLTGVTNNIIVGLSVGIAAVLGHGMLRTTDDLFLEDEEEANRPLESASARFVEESTQVPLKNATSATYSLS